MFRVAVVNSTSVRNKACEFHSIDADSSSLSQRLLRHRQHRSKKLSALSHLDLKLFGVKPCLHHFFQVLC